MGVHLSPVKATRQPDASLRLRAKLWLRFVGLLLAFVASPASAELDYSSQAMQFGIVRSDGGSRCEPTCPEWISAQGTIRADTPALFKRVLKMLEGRKLPIIVDSPGGDVTAAMELGRLIRKNKLDIAVGKTTCGPTRSSFATCHDPFDDTIIRYIGKASDHGAICNSACPLMLAGGNRRLVGEEAFLGVHQITTTHFRVVQRYRITYRVIRGKRYKITTETGTREDRSYNTYKMSKSLEKKIGNYLNEMGIEKGVLITMKNTPARAIHQLELQNMLRMKVVTSQETLDLFTYQMICLNDPMPANCRKIVVPEKESWRTEVPKEVPAWATSPNWTSSKPKAELPSWSLKDWSRPSAPYTKP